MVEVLLQMFYFSSSAHRYLFHMLSSNYMLQLRDFPAVERFLAELTRNQTLNMLIWMMAEDSNPYETYYNSATLTINQNFNIDA
jgi:hypothetical protein